MIKRPRTPTDVQLPTSKSNVSPKLRQRAEMQDGNYYTMDPPLRPQTADGTLPSSSTLPPNKLPSLGALFLNQPSPVQLQHSFAAPQHPYAAASNRSLQQGLPSPALSQSSNGGRYGGSSTDALSSSSSRGSDPSLSSSMTSIPGWPPFSESPYMHPYASPSQSPIFPPQQRMQQQQPYPTYIPSTAPSPYPAPMAYHAASPLMQSQSPPILQPSASPAIAPSPARLRAHHPQAGSSGSSYRGSVDDGGAKVMVGGPMAAYPPLSTSPQEEARAWLSRGRRGEDVGLKLEDLEMIDTLGTGTFGRVLLVKLRHPRANFPTFFAMKVLIKYEVHRMGQIEHINWERAILAGISHPSIVNLLCTFQDERNLYILLEFVQGGELFSHLRRAVRFTADVARFYAANILLALEYLHSRDVIYRDLKPENLLLDSQGYIKITDFGFAKYVPDRTFTLCGTPHFLSPETIRGTGHGKAADWWAFGVLLFEMLCGYPPFFDENPLVIYEKILNGHIVFPPYIDPLAKDLIKRLLTADLSRRLGNLRNAALDIKTHSWFAGVDWGAVARREITAPIVPRNKGQGDMSHFERYPPTNLRDLPALERAQLRRQLGAAYTEPRHLVPDPHRVYFESFG